MWKDWASEHGFGGISPHGLRHGAATLLLAAGVPDAVVMRTMGHADTRILARCQDVVSELQRGAVRRWTRSSEELHGRRQGSRGRTRLARRGRGRLRGEHRDEANEHEVEKGSRSAMDATYQRGSRVEPGFGAPHPFAAAQAHHHERSSTKASMSRGPNHLPGTRGQMVRTPSSSRRSPGLRPFSQRAFTRATHFRQNALFATASSASTAEIGRPAASAESLATTMNTPSRKVRMVASSVSSVLPPESA
jgi:hypothetical protein